MTTSQPDKKEQAKAEQAVDMNKIRAVLKDRAQKIDAKIKRLDRATFVSQDTLRLEFKI